MRVICIESAVWQDGPNAGAICVHKGSVYHVTGSITGEQIYANTGIPAAYGHWFNLLEVPGAHHHARFLEIPDDDFEEGIQQEQIDLDEELNNNL